MGHPSNPAVQILVQVWGFEESMCWVKIMNIYYLLHTLIAAGIFILWYEPLSSLLRLCPPRALADIIEEGVYHTSPFLFCIRSIISATMA